MEIDETNPFDTLPVFHDVFFTIIPSPDLVDDAYSEVLGNLEDEGAEYIPYDASLKEPLHGVTHIVSTTSDFPQYEAALDMYIHVVKPSWVKHSLEKGKQSNPKQFSPDRNLIMSDVVISCADIPEGDKEAIAGGCLALGGLYGENLSKLTTHLVALTVDNQRCQVAVKKNLRCKIVLPHWFDDCLRLGKRISETPYLLPNPEILRKQDRPPAQRISPDVVGASTPHPIDQLPSPTPSTDGSREVDVFNGKNVKFSDDLELGPDTQKTLSNLIVSGGGAVVSAIASADIYVCRYRDGEDYIHASQRKIDVGNLAWLYHVITNNRWTSPMRRLLHYPVPRKGVPGFENLTISVSNYSGEARAYLENLVRACGAEFTKTMHQNNTHLITAHLKSEKCEAAKDWNINVINHLWIEESYARYQLQSLTIKRYTHFPERINLGEVVGQTQLDSAVIEKNFFPKPKQPRVKAKAHANEPLHEVDNMDIDDAVPTSGRKGRRYNADVQTTPMVRKSTEFGKENETPGSRSAKDKALSRLHESAADIAQYEREKKRKGGVIHGRERRLSTDGVTTPANRKSIDALTPGNSTSRGAKDKALSKLHDNAVDIAQYERERKRKGGVTHGKDRGSFHDDGVTEQAHRGKKRCSTEMEQDENETEEDEEQEEADDSQTTVKKGKKIKAEQVESYRMVLTGYHRWVDNPKVEPNERNLLRNLGIHITEDPLKAQILCAPKILRTPKFVCALANSPIVVNTGFLDYCIKNKKLADPTKYLLTDRESEERLGFDLQNSLKLATDHNHKLLDTWQVFCTDQIKGGFDTFKSIVEANGGSCLRYQGRTQMTVKKRRPEAGESQGEETKEPLYLLSGESPAERALWPKFKQMAENADMTPFITKSDWLLNAAMSQEIAWDDKWELA